MSTPPPIYAGARPTVADSIALVDWLCERGERLRQPRHPLRPDIDGAIAALGLDTFSGVTPATEGPQSVSPVVPVSGQVEVIGGGGYVLNLQHLARAGG